MSMILVAVLALVINCDGLSSYLSRPAMIDSSQSVYIKTYVLNCFPSSDITAFITFERDRVSRLRYGKVAIVNATLQPNSDFVIQFRQKLTDIVYHNLTNFGFMEAVLRADMQILLIIGRDSMYPASQPKHHLETFDKLEDFESESSKLYVYNAMWNTINPNGGINLFGLFKRSNIDGSESETVTRLIDNLRMNEGREIRLEPGKKLHIKATYATIGSVLQFKNTEVQLEEEDFTAIPSVRYYLILHGDYGQQQSQAKPSMRILSATDTPSAAYSLVPISTLSIFITTIILSISL